MYRYSIFPEVRKHLLIQLILINKDMIFIVGDYQITQHDRETADIPAAHIHHPCDIIQRGYDVTCCVLFLHYCTDIRQLILCAFSTVCLFQKEAFFRRQRRTVLPDHTDKVFLCGNSNILVLQLLHNVMYKSGVHDTSVKAKHTVFPHMLTDICRNLRHAFLSLLHQINRAVLQLICRLNEIPSICP